MSDTLISFDSRLGRPSFHALKLLSISPSTVLGFSGNHELAIQIFFELVASRAGDLEISELANLISLLRTRKSHHFSTDADAPDFLIASIEPAVTLFRVNEHGINKSDNYAWIGNSQAAAFLSTNLASGDDLDDTRVFQQVVDANNFEDVGGHIVHMHGGPTGFKFTPYMRLISPRYIPTDGWQTVDFGSAQTGGFGYTTVAPCTSGHNGYGVYFFQGAVGLFFWVDPIRKVSETLKAFAATAEDFIKTLEDEVGFALQFCGTLN